MSKVRSHTVKLHRGEAHVSKPTNSHGHRSCLHLSPDGTSRFLGIVALRGREWHIVSKSGAPCEKPFRVLVEALVCMETGLLGEAL